MAIAFNPNEDQREGAPTASNGSVPPDPQSPLVFHHGHGSSSSGGSSQSTSASSSTNSSPGAVSGPIPVPQLLHQQYAAQQPTLYYYPHNSGSTQMPPQSPVLQTPIYRQYNNEELIQAICEALHRCSNGSLPPPSPSCNPPYTPATVPLTPHAVYGQGSTVGETGNVFFPSNMPVTPHAYYSSQPPPQTPTSQPSYYAVSHQPQQLYFQYHSVPPTSPYPSTTLQAPQTESISQDTHGQPTTSTSSGASSTHIPRRAARRIRLSSRCELSPSTSVPRININAMTIGDANNNSNSDSDNPLQDHLEAYLEARERLEEFPGRVPQRRKKAMAATPSSSTSSSPAAKKVALQSDNSSVVITSQNQQNRHTKNSSNELISAKDIPTATENSHRSTAQVECKQKTKEQCVSWSLVTAFVLVVGCGFFASR